MNQVLGIVGGGQLGRMLALAGKQMNIKTIVLDPTPQSPAGKVTDQIVGNYKNSASINKLAKLVDFMTFEIEGANAKVLNKLAKDGFKINPSPQSLEIIQDKLMQKQFLLSNELPLAEFAPVKTETDIKKVSSYLGYPLILKARFHGFDGRGNALIKSQKDIRSAMQKLKGKKLLVEKYIPFKKELAIQAVRSEDGSIRTYPLVETVQKNGICNVVKYPAGSTKKVESIAKNIATTIVKLFTGAGIFGVEMFETKEGKVLVNEIAPRVHNSGHWTIEGSFASQFENHIRAVTNRPLKSADAKVKAAVMINILGNRNGRAHPKGLEKARKITGVYVHLYDKTQTRKERKMGHITVVGNNLETVYKKALEARSLVSI